MRLATLGVLALFGLGAFASPVRADIDKFVGTWTNVESGTRGITRIVIRARRGRLRMRVFGSCRPTDCDWGRARPVVYGPDISSDAWRDARAITAVYDNEFSETILVIRAGRRDRLRVRALTRFTDGSRRSNYVVSYSFTRAREAARVPEPAPRRLREDCISFDPRRVRVRRIDGRWKIVEGRHWIADFGRRGREARQGLDVIRHYGLDRQCFVGRPNPSMTYFLAGSRIPGGAMPGEDCVGFDPAKTRLRRVDGRWKIADGNHWIMDFGGNRPEASQALTIMRHYGARRSCFVGRPGPSMTYLRR